MKTGGLTRRGFAVLTAGAAAAAALPAVGQGAEGEVQPRPWPKGRATPALALPSHEGPPWSLAGARGSPVLLNFWASWCEPCRSEMPSLELLAQRHEARGLQVMAINFRETDAAVRRYLAQWPITLPILRDADGTAARAFGVRIFPTTIAVARDGRAVFSVVGEADWTGSEAQRWIAPLLSST
ncbi:Thiol:disulfide oxidoreductase [Rubrivivax sp. A210]|uniref:TlpA family protein disulfide reductase n=1 Tax=Rubrivivax sp. A210 TaxID=2772301 RepID=UPI001917BD26|nr:TlpA disulfide reductase family protein [Rubrivivax sp. A210]CAD5373797.1 Thiol:disulfide oxidoreductase [Rubrivivax sp. A210]